MDTIRILIVEDEFLIRLTLAEALSEAGFDVLEASSGDEAIEILRASRDVRLLLTDIQLPGTRDGRALAAEARDVNPDLPVIFMTGRPDSLGTLSSVSREIFIAKPYLPSEVCKAAKMLTGEDDKVARTD